MNRVKIDWLALLVSSAITLSASAAAETFTACGLDVIWTNSGAVVWDVNGAPRTPGGALPGIAQSVAVNTDGSGKITGSGTMEITYNSTGLPLSRFVVDITGRISSTASKPNPAVTLNVKGSGYTIDGSGQATTTLNSLNLKFVGQPGPNPSNPNQTRIVGTISGTIKGPTPLNNSSAKLSGLVAFISNSSSGFAQLSIPVVQNNTRLLVFDSDWSGNGLVSKTNAYRLNVKGLGSNRGSSLSLTGNLGAYTNNVGTNPVVFLAPVSAEAKGKIAGQVVSGAAASAVINAGLITN